jgi:hypothetical protein
MSLLYRKRIAGALLLLTLVCRADLGAQGRKYYLGATVDVVGGRSNSQNDLGLFLGRGTASTPAWFYEAYPAIDFRSIGRRSSFETSYVYGLTRFNEDSKYNSDSHVVTARLDSQLSRNVKLTLIDSFQKSSSFTTFSATRGVPIELEGFRFLIDPAAFDQSSKNNNATVIADYTINDKSTVTFNGSHSLLRYTGAPFFNGTRISDQQRSFAGVIYTKATSEHNSVSIGYSTAYLDFSQFDDAQSHAISLGLTHKFSQDLTLQVSAGPSYVHNLGSASSSYRSYNANVAVQKLIGRNTLAAHYSRESGETAGAGSVSDNNRAGLTFSRALRRQTSVVVDVSAFDARNKRDRAYSVRGGSAAANFGVPLGPVFSLHLGGQYQRYAQTSLFPFEQKRVYVSLRMNLPEFWKHQ